MVLCQTAFHVSKMLVVAEGRRESDVGGGARMKEVGSKTGKARF